MTELYILGFAVIGLAIWIRGCARASAADCVLALVIGVVSAVIYFFVFSLTHTAYFAAMMLAVYLLPMAGFSKMRRSSLGRAMAAVVVVLAAAAAMAEYKLVSAGNVLLVIQPYRDGKMWRFDEPRLHLKGEPFVQGIPEMIDKMVKDIPGSERSVRLIFSQQPFPGSQFRLDRVREQDGGNWYYSEEYQMQGWLCPALFKFFARAPQHLYVKAEGV